MVLYAVGATVFSKLKLVKLVGYEGNDVTPLWSPEKGSVIINGNIPFQKIFTEDQIIGPLYIYHVVEKDALII